MIFSIIVSLRHETQAFSRLFSQLASMLRPEEFELLVADSGNADIDYQKLAEKTMDAGVRFLLIRQTPEDHIVAGYDEAIAAATGDVFVHLDPSIILPPDFIEICRKFAEAEKILVPRPWVNVMDHDAGYWAPPTYRTVIIPRSAYGLGEQEARWTYRDMTSPYEEYFSVVDFAAGTPVIVAKLPGFFRLEYATIKNLRSTNSLWRLTAPPMSEGIHEDDARCVLHGTPVHSAGVLLPAPVVPFWSPDTAAVIAEHLQQIASTVMSKYAIRPDISRVQNDVEDMLWQDYWSGQIAAVPSVSLKFIGNNLQIRSAGNVRLPFNREGYDGPRKVHCTPVWP